MTAAWVRDCLIGGGSLFTPGREVWANPVVADLYARFVEQLDVGSGSFVAQLESQLADAPPETYQLAAEAL